MRHRRLARFAANGFGLIVFLVAVFPVYWMVATSLKPAPDVLRYTPKVFPSPLVWSNYSQVWHMKTFWSGMRMSLSLTLIAVGVGLVVAFLGAVAIARFKFRGRTSFILLLIVIQMIPGEALFIPFYLILRDLGALNQLWAVAAVYMSFVIPLSTWLLRGFVVAVPPDLEQAALVDGCSRWQAFWRILFPLVAPGIVATSIFGFIAAWNEFTYAYVLLNKPEDYTMPVWIQSFVGARTTDFGPMMAMATLFMVPVVIFFLVMQRRAVAGLTAGAVKG